MKELFRGVARESVYNKSVVVAIGEDVVRHRDIVLGSISVETKHGSLILALQDAWNFDVSGFQGEHVREARGGGEEKQDSQGSLCLDVC